MSQSYSEKQVVKAERIVDALTNLKIDIDKEVKLYILSAIANASIYVVDDIVSLINGKIITTANDLLKIFPKLNYAYRISLNKDQERIGALNSKISDIQYGKLNNIIEEKANLNQIYDYNEYMYGAFLNSYKGVVHLYRLFYKENPPYFDELIRHYSNLDSESFRILDKLTNHPIYPTFWKNNSDVNNLLSCVSECTSKSVFAFVRKSRMQKLCNYIDEIVNRYNHNNIEERVKKLLK